MKKHFVLLPLAAALSLSFSSLSRADEMDELLGLVPADSPITIVMPNPTALEHAAQNFAKQFGGKVNFLMDLKEYGEQLDLTKPLAMSVALPEDEKINFIKIEGCLFLPIKNFSAFVEQHAGVQTPEKFWGLHANGDDWIVTQKGGYAILASSNPQSKDPAKLLNKILATKPVLNEGLAEKGKLHRDSHLFVHLSIPAWRKTLASSVKQGRQFLPLLAMGASQSGTDPTTVQQMFTGMLDLVEEFFMQCANLDFFLRLEESRGHLTTTATFEKGPIAEYLHSQKAGGTNLFAGLPNQEFAVAFAMDQQGTESKAIEYFMNKVFPSKSDNNTFSEMLSFMQGYSGIMGVGKEKSQATELYIQYFSKEPRKLLELVEKFLQTQNSFLETFGKGIKYKAAGQRKLGEVEIHDWEMNADDAPDLVQESMERVYGDKPIFSLALGSFGLRYGIGEPKTCDDFLSAKIRDDLPNNSRLRAALAKVPAQSNAIAFIDLAQIMKLGQAMSPIETENVTQLPSNRDLVAISLSLAGEPPRLDLDLPFEPLKDLFTLFAKATTPSAEMDSSEELAPLAVGSAAPDFELKNEKGETVSLKSLRGKVVLMDFWATWCGPCRKSMPGIQKIHEQFSGKPVAVYGINCWEESPQKAKDFMKEKKFSYGLLLEGDEVAEDYRVSGIPTFYLIGPDGKILYRSSGFSPGEEKEIIERIEKAIPK